MEFYAGMDIGGTVGRIKLEGVDGTLIGEFYGKGGTLNTAGYEICNQLYREFVIPILEQHGLRAENCRQICIAASGIDSSKQEQECRRSFEEMGFLSNRIQVYNDCEVFLHTYSGPSIILVCGTGSIAFARNAAGSVARCGGWGHVLSDEGSGFSMGMKVIREVANHIDGRCFCPVLHHIFVEKTGLKTLNQINAYVNEMLLEKREIASYAVMAEQAYELGEGMGIDILRECRDELFNLVMDCYYKAELHLCDNEDVKLLFWGSVLLENKIIGRELRDMIEESLPGVVINVPEMTALETTLAIAKM